MSTKYRQIVRMQRCLVGQCEHTVTVRNINRQYHVRVWLNGQVNQEAVCYRRQDIGFTARSLLRWEDKCGNISSYASSARERHNRELPQP
jgi:hypothetical protein